MAAHRTSCAQQLFVILNDVGAGRAAADIQKAVQGANVEAMQLDLASFECAPLSTALLHLSLQHKTTMLPSLLKPPY